jgi:hypothetical protein
MASRFGHGALFGCDAAENGQPPRAMLLACRRRRRRRRRYLQQDAPCTEEIKTARHCFSPCDGRETADRIFAYCQARVSSLLFCS